MNKGICLCCGKEIEDGLWHRRCIKSFFNSTSLPEIDINKEELESLAISQIQDKKSIAGVQEKLSLHLNTDIKKRPRLTIIGFPTGYILKPQSSTYKNLPEFEQTAMLLADLCNIPTVPHGLIPINKENELAYISKRIDRLDNKKIHMEDFCQASNNLTENKYRSSYEECMSLINQYSVRPELDKALLFTVLYFSFVIGNSDVHLKNFSFIMDDNGKLTLSPFYDILPTKIILPSDHDDLGMLFDGRKTNLRKHNFDNFCLKVGISFVSQRKIMQSIEDKVPEMERIINNSSLDQNSKSSWIRMIHRNIERSKQP